MKKGDKVIYTKNNFLGFTKNKVYIVDDNASDLLVCIKEDNDGVRDWWFKENFQLIDTKKRKMTEEDKKLLKYYHFTRGDYTRYHRLREIIPKEHPELEVARQKLIQAKKEIDELVMKIVES